MNRGRYGHGRDRYCDCVRVHERVTRNMMSELIQDGVRIYCQDRFSQLEVDADGSAGVIGEHVRGGK